MNEIEELRGRVEAVEARMDRLAEDGVTTRAMAALTDRDVADFRQELRGHRHSLNALRETQVEQGQALSGLRETQVEHGQALSGLRDTQVEHGRTLGEHTATLAEHTATLAEHSGALGTLLTGQAAIMRHLGIADEGDGEQTRG